MNVAVGTYIDCWIGATHVMRGCEYDRLRRSDELWALLLPVMFLLLEFILVGALLEGDNFLRVILLVNRCPLLNSVGFSLLR